MDKWYYNWNSLLLETSKYSREGNNIILKIESRNVAKKLFELSLRKTWVEIDYEKSFEIDYEKSFDLLCKSYLKEELFCIALVALYSYSNCELYSSFLSIKLACSFNSFFIDLSCMRLYCTHFNFCRGYRGLTKDHINK